MPCSCSKGETGRSGVGRKAKQKGVEGEHEQQQQQCRVDHNAICMNGTCFPDLLHPSGDECKGSAAHFASSLYFEMVNP
jgi:hypothetical protein